MHSIILNCELQLSLFCLFQSSSPVTPPAPASGDHVLATEMTQGLFTEAYLEADRITRGKKTDDREDESEELTQEEGSAAAVAATNGSLGDDPILGL